MNNSHASRGRGKKVRLAVGGTVVAALAVAGSITAATAATNLKTATTANVSTQAVQGAALTAAVRADLPSGLTLKQIRDSFDSKTGWGSSYALIGKTKDNFDLTVDRYSKAYAAQLIKMNNCSHDKESTNEIACTQVNVPGGVVVSMVLDHQMTKGAVANEVFYVGQDGTHLIASVSNVEPITWQFVGKTAKKPVKFPSLSGSSPLLTQQQMTKIFSNSHILVSARQIAMGLRAS
ncbi:hypothetical protein [Streptomyces sp. NPDC047009]|uniref:hypothetical protein n=1 Tax=Streptomyces sp. NPDC047009 TaxID=3154496 RepID=UPI0033FCD4E0